MIFRNFFFFFLFSINTICLYSQIGGSKTYDFLNLPASARVVALGGTLLSTKANDISLAIANPALLSDTMNNTISLNYVNFFADINYGYVAYAKNIKKNHNVAGAIQYLNYGKFNNTDEYGNVNGTFGASDISINLSYARPVVDSNLTCGVTLKTIYSNLNNITSWGSALDMGWMYVIPKYGLGLAALVKNAGVQWTTYASDGKREKLPFEMQLGCSKRLRHAPVVFSLTYQNMERWSMKYNDTVSTVKHAKIKNFGDNLMRHLVIGGELNITKNFFVRVGYNYQRREELKFAAKKGLAGFSFGLGLRIYKFQLSYGRASYNIAGAANTFSIACDLDSFYQKKKAN